MEPEKAQRLVQPTGQVRHLIALGGPRQGRSLGQRLGGNAVSAWLKKSRPHGWLNRKRLRARLRRRRCLRASDPRLSLFTVQCTKARQGGLRTRQYGSTDAQDEWGGPRSNF